VKTGSDLLEPIEIPAVERAINYDIAKKDEVFRMKLDRILAASENSGVVSKDRFEWIGIVYEPGSFFGELLACLDNCMGLEWVTLNGHPVFLDHDWPFVDEKVRVDILPDLQGDSKNWSSFRTIRDDGTAIWSHILHHLEVCFFLGSFLGNA
jgi:hypothetical protein